MKHKIKKSLMALMCLVSLQGFAGSETTPLWMRYPNISPDGEQIAFAYKGDIYTVSAKGGQAKQLTTGQSYESQPIWSNDSKTIAFVSDRFGGMDIFTVPATGGQAKRITTHSGTETPLAFSPDNKQLYFSASIQDPASSILWASWMQEIYKVSVDGGRPYQVVASPICSISFDTDGESFLYYDRTGSENIWRKHHVSSVARNIFYYDAKTGKHTQLTTNPGEDRDPIFTGKDKMVFLSERNGGSFNVYESSIKDTENAKALTTFKKHPVRFLSRATDGTLCFGYQGEIYTMQGNGKPAKVAVNILNDKTEQIETLKLTGAGQFDMSDNGKQLVLVARGEVFATTDKYATTKQITRTPEAESGATISPDGKTIVYASERTGVWNLYKATHSADEPNFANATVIEEEPLFKDNKIERTSPTFSPDGKEIAFIEDRQ
ncbi:MAG: PD40 domain-containing protein, partial [Bacteroidales bacterium]|nr:PD40 domain-containing protein [Bacteroidales bacterium]